MAGAGEGSEPTIAAETPAGGRAPQVPSSARLRRGDSVERYLVLEALGEGGMGVVYAAYDPELDRKVAIKFLRAAADAGDERGVGRVRLQREAQAMARLTHRNVVGIYDVGVVDDRVFVAMELIEGETLRGWLAARPRGWREVLAALLQAGEGLAAAHAAGLVHRDFKPDNVLVARDGRVCVADFGLASAGGASAGAGPVRSAAAGPLTLTGAVMGTPAYMAPEQFRGEPASAAADIFAFCVTAHEALLGERPFAGETLLELSMSVCGGELKPPPRGRGVPSRVLRIVRRGLDPELSRRPASMRALLDALARAPGARRRWIVGGAGALAAACAGALALLPGDDATCSGAAEAIAAAWGPDAAATVRAGLLATGLSYAADTASRVEAGLDRYAAGWAREHTEVCEATRVRGEQSERLLDLRMICLERRRERVTALVELFAAADAGVVERAVSLVAGLPDVGDCADAHALVLDDEPAEQLAAADRELIERGMDQGLLLHQAGRYEAARAVVLPAVERARAVAGPRLRARALQKYAGMLCFSDDASAGAPAREALAATLVAGDLRGFADVAACMLDLEHEAGRDVELWRQLSEAALTGVGGDDQIRAKALTNYGNALRVEGRREEALAILREVVALRRGSSNRRPEVLGDALFNLSSALLGAANEEEGIRVLHEAIAVWRENLGPEHPRLLLPLRTLVLVHFRRGELAEARALAEPAVSSLERLYGPSHSRVGDMDGLLGNVLLALGDFPGARRSFERSLAIARENPSKRRTLAYALANLGNHAMTVGELAEAERLFSEANEVLSEIASPPHPDLVIMEANFGGLALRRGDVATAEARLREALAMFEKVKEGPEQIPDPDIAIGFAAALERRGDPRAALEVLGRLAGGGPSGLALARDRAAARAVEARARWALDERAAALEAARAAARDYASVRPGYAREAEALARWLAERE